MYICKSFKNLIIKKQMINITLPDGTIKKYPKGTTAIEVAEGISSGLARNVLAAER